MGILVAWERRADAALLQVRLINPEMRLQNQFLIVLDEEIHLAESIGPDRSYFRITFVARRQYILPVDINGPLVESIRIDELNVNDTGDGTGVNWFMLLQFAGGDQSIGGERQNREQAHKKNAGSDHHFHQRESPPLASARSIAPLVI